MLSRLGVSVARRASRLPGLGGFSLVRELHSAGMVRLVQEVYDLRRPLYTDEDEAKAASTTAKSLKEKADKLRKFDERDSFLAGPSGERDQLADEVALLVGRLVDVQPGPGRIASHDELDITRYEHIKESTSPLAGFFNTELSRAIFVLDEAEVRTSDVFPPIASEIASRAGEFPLQDLVRVMEILHRRQFQDNGVYKQIAQHVARRSREARPIELVSLLEIVNQRGIQCPELVVETVARYAMARECPTPSRSSSGFARLVRAVIESGHAPASFCPWVDEHLRSCVSELEQTDLSSILSLVEGCHALSRATRECVDRDARRRAHDEEARKRNGPHPEWFGSTVEAQAV